MKHFLLVLTLLSVGVLHAMAQRPAPFSVSVGTQSVGVRYTFTDRGGLLETVDAMAELGSDTVKIALTPNYPDDYLLEENSGITSLIDLVTVYPEYLEAMDMPFRNVMLWVYPFSDSKSAFFEGTISPEEREAIYQEVYDFTAFILERYSGSGKSFFFGNWEGDWHVLREIYNYELDPLPETIEASIEWFNLREQAIADARRDTPHEDVEVYYYIELNHVRKAMDDNRPTIVNRILPYIRTDFVSWSSYDITIEALEMDPEAGRARVFAALDYIEAHLPESDIPGKRVFIGEYGYKLDHVGDVDRQRNHTATMMKWGLEWGCPFILYWEIYCNEIDPATGEHRGFWMIDDHGIRQPVWFLHQEFLERANAWVAAYEVEHGTMPDQATFNAEAATWFVPVQTFDIDMAQ